MNTQPGDSADRPDPPYRGRLAPSPTGWLHLGHVRTFDVARDRAGARAGQLILRNDDLDQGRCKKAFVEAMYEDLRWLGFSWSEGPDMGGPFAPYDQSRRTAQYRRAWERLRRDGWIYPCFCSRRDIRRNLAAPHEGDEEPIYPGTCRPENSASGPEMPPSSACWRFRVPDGEAVRFDDGNLGVRTYLAGRDFGDFVVWRRDGIPSYHLAAVVDDAAMQITEVVRGADLLLSTARQWLLFRALGRTPPGYFHCPLVRDENGRRLAKRDGAMGIPALRAGGYGPAEVLRMAREGAGGSRYGEGCRR